MKYLYNQKTLYDRRKELRRRETEAEKLLWKYLRKKQINNLKVYRQYSIGPYIVDFFCPEANLAVEIDGSSHDHREAKDYDRERTNYLSNFDVKVIRFRNEEVLAGITEVVSRIHLLLDKRRQEEL